MLASAEFPQEDARTLVRMALAEDVGTGDVTSQWTLQGAIEATLLAKQNGVIAGTAIAALVFEEMGAPVQIAWNVKDGDQVKSGDRLATIRGATVSLLTAERVILNFLQQLSGVATITRAHQTVLDQGYQSPNRRTYVLDTRKTIPGFRRLQKYAVLAGGGRNHRMGLHDMVLVKDNHIAACGGVVQAWNAIKSQNHQGLKVEIETENLQQVASLLGIGVDRIMLDNMDTATMIEAVRMVRASGDPVELEASGNMDLDRLRELAPIGLDYISVGALTHSVKALDISMRIL